LIKFLFLIVIHFSSLAQTDFIISPNSACPIKLGQSFEEALLIFAGYEITSVENGFLVSRKGEKLLAFWSKGNEHRIGMIEVYSPSYQTSDGLKVGLKVNEILKIRRDLQLTVDEMTGEEYFAPRELQTPSEKFYEILCLLYVKSYDGEKIGHYPEKTFPEKSIGIIGNGEIKYFRIYYWN